ncbi:YraN family protein [Actinokineospora auranticolor]|uniref:UPF0102 protein CLV40_120130 n=1 Tax=Actinokineospora auranticolor TaxID=155976 RepID=A0A2S6GGQ6_9PSEU|nr:YraN family protein [Actinokineospora auranticolor]PPK64407.1 putative endonuclease [Actinokineospora auranticolor]
MAKHLRLGALGEDIAARHLESTGHVILARNWRCELGELDIICDHHGELVVCEVKTRSGTQLGPPAAAVTDAKANRIRALATRWRQDNGIAPCRTRFDIIAVLVPRAAPATLRHHRGVL